MKNNNKKLIRPLITIGVFMAVFAFISWWGNGTVNNKEAVLFPTTSEKGLAPDFTLQSTTGGTITLSDFRGKKNVLLYFQEGIMCDPCWTQIVDIEKVYDKFEAMDMELVTIAVDPLNAMKKNAKRFGITLPILEDADLKVSTAYDVLTDSMHPGSRPGHTFVLVNKDGNIVWKKPYFEASGSTKMTMMGMEMEMGMDMGKPGANFMYVPVDKLLADIASMNMANPEMSEQDHSMCLTPIHNHVDFKMYVGGNAINFSERNHMDQSNIIHFHPTVKIKPDDIPNVPVGDLIHLHKDGATLGEFLQTLDFLFDIDTMKGLKVYANGSIQSAGLNYVLKDKERILLTDSTDATLIQSQIDSVTDYALQGKEKNISLFGGC